MNRHIAHLYKALLLLALTVSPGLYAERDADSTPDDGLYVEVELEHKVIISEIIYFRVGSATPGEVSKVKFDLGTSFTSGSYSGATPPAGLGDGTEITATENGTLDVDVRGNSGPITITYEVSNTSGLSNGNGQFIPFDEIKVVSSDAVNLPTPTLSNTGGAAGSAISVTVPANAYDGKVVDEQGTWTYTYLNTTPRIAGEYNGRVTYTASAP